MPNENGKSEKREEIPLYTFQFFSKNAKQEQTLTLHAVILYIVANSVLEIPQEWVEDIRKKVKRSPQVLCKQNDECQTPLHLAAEGFAGLTLLKIFKEYLEANNELQKKTLSLRDEDDRTILDILFLKIILNTKISTGELEKIDFEELVIYFIKYGVSIDLNTFGKEFLNGAAERGFIKIIEALVKYQFNDFSAIDKNVFDEMNVHVKENFNCKKVFFHEVCRIIGDGKTEDKELLAYVEETGGEPALLTYHDDENRTLCHWAAVNNRWDLVKQFIIQLHKINKLEILRQEDLFNQTVLDCYEEYVAKSKKFVFIEELLKAKVLSWTNDRMWDLKIFLMEVKVGPSGSELKLISTKLDDKRKAVFATLYNKIIDSKISNADIKKFVNAQETEVVIDVLAITDGKDRNLLHYAALYTRSNIFDLFLDRLSQKSMLAVINAKDWYQKTPLDYLLAKLCLVNLNKLFIKDFEEFLAKFINNGARISLDSPGQFFLKLVQLKKIGFSGDTLRLIFQSYWHESDDAKTGEFDFKGKFLDLVTLEEKDKETPAYELTNTLIPMIPESSKQGPSP